MALTPAQNRFRQGDRVEVSGTGYGFIGSYHLATVVEHFGGKYKVKYESLVDDEDESKQLQEVVEAEELRPPPPPPSEKEKDGKFDVLDRVDVYAMDAWWVGTLTKVKKKGRNQIYSVYFETTADLCDYSKEQLRFHKDWIDGAWVDCKRYVGIKKRVWIEDNVKDRYKKVRIDGELVDCKDRLRVSFPTADP